VNELEPSALDAAVRAALDAGPEVAQRVARGALTAPTRRRSRSAPLVALLVVAVAVAWLSRRDAAAPPAQAIDIAPAVHIVNHGGIVSAVDPRHVSLAVDSSRWPAAPPRRLFIVRGGDS
jgi:hypothetical protein